MVLLETTPRTKGSFIRSLVKLSPLTKEIKMERSARALSLFVGFLIFTLAINSLFLFKYNGIKQAQAVTPEIKTVAQMKKELDCMALNIYRESAYEPIEGRIAVAQVTMNRVASPNFPNDICSVVYQKNIVYSKIVCQFSWYCDAAHMARPINQKAYQESYEVAKKVVLEGFRLEKMQDALYYHAVYVNPRWKLERIDKIGQHIFYRPKGPSHPQLAGRDA
jgi:spore germination cell wall hydrolase CwlJ-like protein